MKKIHTLCINLGEEFRLKNGRATMDSWRHSAASQINQNGHKLRDITPNNHTTSLSNCHNWQDIEPHNVTPVSYLNGIHIRALINNLVDNINKCTGIKSTLSLKTHYYSDMFRSSEDDVKRTETWSISGLYVKVYF